MKKTIIFIGITAVALWFSFYTENLTERKRREAMKELKPEQLVSMLMKDSLSSLEERAVMLDEVLTQAGNEEFARQHGRVLGIGSPTFYVMKGVCDQTRMENDEIHATVKGVELTIPLKYIFGNTARDASGWFNIDNFQNTMDFNAVSAAMNDFIAKEVKNYHGGGRLSFLGAVAIKNGQVGQTLMVIPYQLK